MKKLGFIFTCFTLLCGAILQAEIPFMGPPAHTEISTDDHLHWFVSTPDHMENESLGEVWRGAYGFTDYCFTGTDGMLQAFTRNANDIWSVWITSGQERLNIGIFRDVTFITPTFEIHSPTGMILQLAPYNWYDTHYTLWEPNSGTVIATLYGSLYFKDHWSLFTTEQQFLIDNNFDFRLILMAVAHRVRIDAQ